MDYRTCSEILVTTHGEKSLMTYDNPPRIVCSERKQSLLNVAFLA